MEREQESKQTERGERGDDMQQLWRLWKSQRERERTSGGGSIQRTWPTTEVREKGKYLKLLHNDCIHGGEHFWDGTQSVSLYQNITISKTVVITAMTSGSRMQSALRHHPDTPWHSDLLTSTFVPSQMFEKMWNEPKTTKETENMARRTYHLGEAGSHRDLNLHRSACPHLNKCTEWCHTPPTPPCVYPLSRTQLRIFNHD